MSDDIEPKDSELLMELSEQEQETVAGGCAMGGLAFFFQQTDIETFAEDHTSFSGRNISGSSSSRTGYKFSQTTFGFIFPFNSRGRRQRGRGMMGNMFNLFQDWTG